MLSAGMVRRSSSAAAVCGVVRQSVRGPSWSVGRRPLLLCVAWSVSRSVVHHGLSVVVRCCCVWRGPSVGPWSVMVRRSSSAAAVCGVVRQSVRGPSWSVGRRPLLLCVAWSVTRSVVRHGPSVVVRCCCVWRGPSISPWYVMVRRSSSAAAVCGVVRQSVRGPSWSVGRRPLLLCMVWSVSRSVVRHGPSVVVRCCCVAWSVSRSMVRYGPSWSVGRRPLLLCVAWSVRRSVVRHGPSVVIRCCCVWRGPSVGPWSVMVRRSSSAAAVCGVVRQSVCGPSWSVGRRPLLLCVAWSISRSVVHHGPSVVVRCCCVWRGPSVGPWSVMVRRSSAAAAVCGVVRQWSVVRHGPSVVVRCCCVWRGPSIGPWSVMVRLSSSAAAVCGVVHQSVRGPSWSVGRRPLLLCVAWSVSRSVVRHGPSWSVGRRPLLLCVAWSVSRSVVHHGLSVVVRCCCVWRGPSVGPWSVMVRRSSSAAAVCGVVRQSVRGPSWSVGRRPLLLCVAWSVSWSVVRHGPSVVVRCCCVWRGPSVGPWSIMVRRSSSTAAVCGVVRQLVRGPSWSVGRRLLLLCVAWSVSRSMVRHGPSVVVCCCCVAWSVSRSMVRHGPSWSVGRRPLLLCVAWSVSQSVVRHGPSVVVRCCCVWRGPSVGLWSVMVRRSSSAAAVCGVVHQSVRGPSWSVGRRPLLLCVAWSVSRSVVRHGPSVVVRCCCVWCGPSVVRGPSWSVGRRPLLLCVAWSVNRSMVRHGPSVIVRCCCVWRGPSVGPWSVMVRRSSSAAAVCGVVRQSVRGPSWSVGRRPLLLCVVWSVSRSVVRHGPSVVVRCCCGVVRQSVHGPLWSVMVRRSSSAAAVCGVVSQTVRGPSWSVGRRPLLLCVAWSVSRSVVRHGPSVVVRCCCVWRGPSWSVMVRHGPSVVVRCCCVWRGPSVGPWSVMVRRSSSAAAVCGVVRQSVRGPSWSVGRRPLLLCVAWSVSRSVVRHGPSVVVRCCCVWRGPSVGPWSVMVRRSVVRCCCVWRGPSVGPWSVMVRRSVVRCCCVWRGPSVGPWSVMVRRSSSAAAVCGVVGVKWRRKATIDRTICDLD